LVAAVPPAYREPPEEMRSDARPAADA
jgi:hypothetical protein